MKVKVKRGKAKIKLKSGDDVMPLSEADIRGLLAVALASAVGAGDAAGDGAATRHLPSGSESLTPQSLLASAGEDEQER